MFGDALPTDASLIPSAEVNCFSAWTADPVLCLHIFTNRYLSDPDRPIIVSPRRK